MLLHVIRRVELEMFTPFEPIDKSDPLQGSDTFSLTKIVIDRIAHYEVASSRCMRSLKMTPCPSIKILLNTSDASRLGTLK